MTILFILTSSSVFAQLFDSGDFHSEFEKKAFEQVEQGKVVDPVIFLFTVNSENEFEDYQQFSIALMKLVHHYQNEYNSIKSQNKQIKKIFKESQKELFKRYRMYHDLSSLLEGGNYNCISGTAFYSIIFRELGYQTHLYETPFHTFLELENDSGERILLESTDRAFGFIDREKNISKRRQEYASGHNSLIPNGIGSSDEFREPAFIKEIDLVKLAALQYYNAAVVEFNEGDFTKASVLLKKAAFLYPSSRIILLQMLSEKMIASLN